MYSPAPNTSHQQSPEYNNSRSQWNHGKQPADKRPYFQEKKGKITEPTQCPIPSSRAGYITTRRERRGSGTGSGGDDSNGIDGTASTEDDRGRTTAHTKSERLRLHHHAGLVVQSTVVLLANFREHASAPQL